MKYLFLVLVILIFGSCSNLTRENAAKFLKTLAKRCMHDKRNRRPELKIFEKCPVQFKARHFDCIPEIRINETLRFQCNGLYFYTSDYIPVKCTWKREVTNIDYKKYCTKLPQHVITANLRKLYLQLNATTIDEIKQSSGLQQHHYNYLLVEKYTRAIDCTVCFLSLLLLFVVPLGNTRFFLHRNLILAFLLDDILELFQLNLLKDPQYSKACSLVSLFNWYFFMAQVSWMFAEGYFQFKQFFFVFVNKTIKLRYIAFGWGFPLLVVFGLYAPAMFKSPPVNNYRICWRVYRYYGLNYIIYAPAFLLLLLNFCIIFYLMWLIWSKLKRGSSGDEFYKARKAARGLLTLVFLLGGGYLITIYGPDDCIDYKYIKAIVRPAQGSFVCISQVFMSKEVWKQTTRKSKKVMNNNLFISRSTDRLYELCSNMSKRMSTVTSLSLSDSRKGSLDPVCANIVIQNQAALLSKFQSLELSMRSNGSKRSDESQSNGGELTKYN